MTSALYKVSLMIFQAGEPEKVLVLAHPDGGYQLVAGTVEVGESPLAAAVRESQEESGLFLQNPGIAWEEVTVLAEPQCVLLGKAEPADSCVLGRGHLVEVLTRHASHAEVVEWEYDLSCEPPREIRTHHGRIDPRLLGSEIVRVFIHGQAHGPDAERNTEWTRHADGREFHLSWMSITKPHPTLLRRDSLALARWLEFSSPQSDP